MSNTYLVDSGDSPVALAKYALMHSSQLVIIREGGIYAK